MSWTSNPAVCSTSAFFWSAFLTPLPIANNSKARSHLSQRAYIPAVSEQSKTCVSLKCTDLTKDDSDSTKNSEQRHFKSRKRFSTNQHPTRMLRYTNLGVVEGRAFANTTVPYRYYSMLNRSWRSMLGSSTFRRGRGEKKGRNLGTVPTPLRWYDTFKHGHFKYYLKHFHWSLQW